MDIKNIVLLVIFILGLVYIQFLQPRSVDEIINKYAEARGGREKLNSISSIYMEGLREMMAKEISIKITKVQNKLYRNDFEFGGNAGYAIVTPREGWSFIPMSSKEAEPIAEDKLKNMQTELDIAGPLINYIAKGHKAVFAGRENIDEKEVYKIRLTLNTGREIIYLIDTETNLLLQTRQTNVGFDNHGNDIVNSEREVITNFGDYKPVDGVLFPHKILNPGNGLNAGLTRVNKIELNMPVDKSKYEVS